MTVSGRDVTHPLDPLSAAELRAASELVRRAAEGGARCLFAGIDLIEPEAVERGSSRAIVDRRALVVLLDREERCTREAVVSLTHGVLLSERRLDDAQPNLLPTEIEAVQDLVRADPGFQRALARRGLHEPAAVMVDSWSVGRFDMADENGSRLVKAVAYLRDESLPFDNGYARPIDGLVALVDLYDMLVVRVDDHARVPVPTEPGNYTVAGNELRTDLKPIVVEQLEGPSFVVDGHAVHWLGWHVRVGFTGREGLVLHDVEHDVDGETRSILRRASFAEMVVPYGDPRPTHFFKNAFDFGEYGIGPLTNSLKLGCDCLGVIHYFDAAVIATDGSARVIENAICLHEEDTGILWKHTDWRTGHVEMRRGRRLVISSIATVGNYEYGFYWYLYQDGTIEAQVKLTGILQTAGVWPDEVMPRHGTLVAPGLVAPVHQHFFCVRLELAVGGGNNTVTEVETVSDPPGPENRHGNAFRAVSRPLVSELAARRDVDLRSGRYWRIVNPTVRNYLGEPVAYRLVPGGNTRPFLHSEAPTLRRAGFIRHHVWVTPLAAEERFPAGDYPNQHPGPDGLPRWTERDRSIENTQLVLWYTFGTHHIPRVEDWPIMPVETAEFRLKPDGFFDRNPTLDVPPPDACHNGTCRH